MQCCLLLNNLQIIFLSLTFKQVGDLFEGIANDKQVLVSVVILEASGEEESHLVLFVVVQLVI